MDILSLVLKIKAEKGGVFFLLIDPDKAENHPLLKDPPDIKPDIVLVGGSGKIASSLSDTIQRIKQTLQSPVIIFPGDATQVCSEADGLLFMTLLSGRNPRFLIEEQVNAAPLIHKHNIPTIPTAYMLIGKSGKSSVERESQTEPIPETNLSSILHHILAAEYMGMKLVYLEAGSGANTPLSPDTIAHLSTRSSLPIIAGGGIRTPETAEDLIKSGATGIVIGNLFENPKNTPLYKKIISKVHQS